MTRNLLAPVAWFEPSLDEPVDGSEDCRYRASDCDSGGAESWNSSRCSGKSGTEGNGKLDWVGLAEFTRVVPLRLVKKLMLFVVVEEPWPILELAVVNDAVLLDELVKVVSELLARVDVLLSSALSAALMRRPLRNSRVISYDSLIL